MKNVINKLDPAMVFTAAVIMWIMVLFALQVELPAGNMGTFWASIVLAVIINIVVLINLWNNTWVENPSATTKVIKTTMLIASMLFAPSLVAWAGYTWYLRRRP